MREERQMRRSRGRGGEAEAEEGMRRDEERQENR